MKKRIFRIVCMCMLVLLSGLFVGCGDLKIDYDLVSQGNTFTQLTVANMQQTPSKYIGKTIKIRGMHYSSGSSYHYLSGYDDTNCCNWEVEIRLKDDSMTFPDTNKNIIVIGNYRSKKVNSRTTYFLEVEEFV